jgi:hypothetical protein
VRRRLVVWFALISALLVMTATPVSAASTSKHRTTDADFAGASLSSMEISGTGESASVVATGSESITTDSFEDQDLSEYTGALSNADITSTSTDGTYSVRLTSNSNNQEIVSTSGLVYPRYGDDFSYDVRHSRLGSNFERTRFRFLYQNSSNYYSVSLNGDDSGRLRISKYAGGSRVETDSVPGVGTSGSTWYTVDVDFKSGGVIEATVDGDSGTYSVSITDSEYQSGGIALVGNSAGGSGDQYIHYDNIGGVYATTAGSFVGEPFGVTTPGTAYADVVVDGASATLTWEGNSGSGWSTIDSQTVTSSGNYSADLASASASEVRLNLTYSGFDGGGDAVELAETGVSYDSAAPVLSGFDPADGSQVETYSGNVSVDVSDPDFSSPGGDAVVVRLLDSTSSEIANATVTANETVTIPYLAVAGSNSLEWTASDDHGQSSTVDHSFSTPAELKLRTETNPSEAITDSGTAEVTFFGETKVETRPITNGTANMSGLPADQTFVAVVSMDGYYDRRILVESLFDQQTVYLLNESETAVNVEFVLDDSTGQYSSGDVELTVDKAIVVNNSTQFRTVVGDRISASGGLPASLEEGARYRLSVSKDGNSRSLGSWTASTGGIVELPIGRVELSGDFDEGWLLEHSIDEPPAGSSAEGLLRLKFADQDGKTESVETQVVRLDETGNVSEVVLANATETDAQSVVRSVEVNNTSDTFAVRYTLVRDGETVSGERELGTLEGITVPMDAGWLNLISWVGVFAFGGLVVIKDSRAAGLVMAGSASLFAMLGWLQAPTPVLGLAAAAAVMYAVAGSGGGY